jgi:hypothetical protein
MRPLSRIGYRLPHKGGVQAESVSLPNGVPSLDQKIISSEQGIIVMDWRGNHKRLNEFLSLFEVLRPRNLKVKGSHW